jgi:hypothetical protein
MVFSRGQRGAWTTQAHTRQNPGRGSTALVPGGVPAAPSNVTSVTADSAATVSFLAPASSGSGPVTSWTVTPYISGSPQTPTTVSTGSAGSITGSNGSTYVQVPVTGLTNSTAYTFTVHASSAYGPGPESAASGANTPLSGLVFGDDFNGPVGGPIDPEWWVYTRCGYLAQSEVEYYLPSQVFLDGSSNLVLLAEHGSYTGPSYPSAGGGNVTQPWLSGACQSNTKTWAPSSGNTMTFEARQQVAADSGDGFWPGLFWLEGQDYLTAWKTDPEQAGWDSTGKAEIDVAEWFPPTAVTNYGNNVFISGGPSDYQERADMGATNPSAAMHLYAVQWKPGVSVTFLRDGSTTNSDTTAVPASGAQFFLLLYLQMLAGGPTTTESCLIDYVRVFDQNLG